MAERPLRSPARAATAEKAAPGEQLLSIRDLTFGYTPEQPILKNLSLELKTSSIVALLGQNGSGKTTLARALIGINPVERGTVYLGDRDISDLGPRENSAEVRYVVHKHDHQLVSRVSAELRDLRATQTAKHTHDGRLLAEWAHRAIALRGGRIAFDGEP